MADWSSQLHWMLTGVIALLIMVESGFTPAALPLIALAIGPVAGRAAAMGVYSLSSGRGVGRQPARWPRRAVAGDRWSHLRDAHPGHGVNGTPVATGPHPAGTGEART